MLKIISHSAQETQSLAKSVAKLLRGGEILALSGPLGSGKTTFVRGLVKGLGVKRQIASPSFVIISSYQFRGKRLQTFYHLDLYRLKNPRSEIWDLGLEEIFQNLEKREGVVAIEWPEKIRKFLPPRTIFIRFNYRPSPKERLIAWSKK